MTTIVGMWLLQVGQDKVANILDLDDGRVVVIDECAVELWPNAHSLLMDDPQGDHAACAGFIERTMGAAVRAVEMSHESPHFGEATLRTLQFGHVHDFNRNHIFLADNFVLDVGDTDLWLREPTRRRVVGRIKL